MSDDPVREEIASELPPELEIDSVEDAFDRPSMVYQIRSTKFDQKPGEPLVAIDVNDTTDEIGVCWGQRTERGYQVDNLDVVADTIPEAVQAAAEQFDPETLADRGPVKEVATDE